MNPDKDYYRILGVLDDAEDIVIRAAYRALAQRYHPDRWKVDQAEATRRMTKINEAYAVLSDAAKRAAYDANRDKNQFRDDSTIDDEDTSESSSINKDWAIATKYLPELNETEISLRRISHELGFTFKLMILESKEFKRHIFVASRLELAYLEKYFGEDKEVQQFAKELILEGRRDAAKELNEVVRVFGSCDKSMIAKIAKEYSTKTHRDAEEKHRSHQLNERQMLAMRIATLLSLGDAAVGEIIWEYANTYKPVRRSKVVVEGSGIHEQFFVISDDGAKSKMTRLEAINWFEVEMNRSGE